MAAECGLVPLLIVDMHFRRRIHLSPALFSLCAIPFFVLLRQAWRRYLACATRRLTDEGIEFMDSHGRQSRILWVDIRRIVTVRDTLQFAAASDVHVVSLGGLRDKRAWVAEAMARWERSKAKAPQ